MEIIAHRANLYGPEPTVENRIETIEKALEQFSVEIDLWYHDDNWWLGHDKPTYKTTLATLFDISARSGNRMYVHCKNVATLQAYPAAWKTYDHKMSAEFMKMVPFFHHDDDCILLPNGIIWLHPKAIHATMESTKTIAVIPGLRDFDYYTPSMISRFYGVCTDYPMSIKETVETW